MRLWREDRRHEPSVDALLPAMRDKTSRLPSTRSSRRSRAGSTAWSGRPQLIAAGVGSRAIVHRVESGRLHPLYRGVYAVGHRVLSQRGRWMAATLATDGVLSHRSAGALWGIRPWTGRIDMTTPRTRAKRPGLLLHRAVLAQDEITAHGRHPRHHPRPHPPRPRGRPAAPSAAAGHQRGRDPPPRRPAPPHDRHPTKRGTRALRALAPPTHTKQDLEARFTTFLNDRRFPRPQTNTSSKGKRSTSRGRTAASSSSSTAGSSTERERAFEDDRRTDRRLKAAGWTVIRITWRDLDDPDALEAEFRALALAPGPR